MKNSSKLFDVAVKLLKTFDPPSSDSSLTWSAVHDVCAMCDATDKETKEALHALAGIIYT